MNSRRRIRHALKLLCGQPIAVGVVWERAEPSSPYDPRSRQFGRASASMMPQAVHTMRGPNPTKAFGRASDRRSAPLRGGRSVGRGSARANRREHDLLRLVRRAVSRIGSQVGERHSGGSGRRGRCHGLPAEACRALNPKCVFEVQRLVSHADGGAEREIDDEPDVVDHRSDRADAGQQRTQRAPQTADAAATPPARGRTRNKRRLRIQLCRSTKVNGDIVSRD
jgi:hypothetical protein